MTEDQNEPLKGGQLLVAISGAMVTLFRDYMGKARSAARPVALATFRSLAAKVAEDPKHLRRNDGE